MIQQKYRKEMVMQWKRLIVGLELRKLNGKLNEEYNGKHIRKSINGNKKYL